VFMKNPVAILSADMASIRRLPITPPTDIFHSNPRDVRFRTCPPKNPDGTIAPCKGDGPSPPQLVPGPNAKVTINKPAVGGDTWIAIILGIIGTLAIIIGVWFGIKMAAGPVGDKLKMIGDSIGKSLAGTYVAVKKAVPTKLPTIPTPTLPAPAPKPADPSSFSVQNPGFKSKADFIASRSRTPPATPKPAPKPGLTVRTPPATPKPKINSGLTVRTPPVSPKPKPAPKPAEPVVMAPNPLGETKDQFIARMKQKRTGGKRKKRRNHLRTGRKV